MDFGYLKEIECFGRLYEFLTEEVEFSCGLPEQQYSLRCISYFDELKNLVDYVFEKALPQVRKTQKNREFIKLINEKEFKKFLGKTEYYQKVHFIYLAACNASFDNSTVDKNTAELAFECLKEITYIVFSKINSFNDTQKLQYQYVKNINHEITEAETRRIYIDTNLKNAHYHVNNTKDSLGHGKPGVNEVCVEIETHNLPHHDVGYIDYVIYNKSGDPIAVIEAKRTSVDEHVGAQQARDYADSLVKDLNLSYRPIIYYTNGYVIKIQDRLGYPSREVSNFASLVDLERLIKRQAPGPDDKRIRIKNKKVDEAIINRSKLIEASHDLIESMDADMRRKGLLVLPCGVGKTRTAVALSKILIDNEWVENVLFLADRNNLVDNAVKPFKKFMAGVTSDISAENPEADLNARFCVCTYNTMLNYINSADKKFSVGHFDLIFVDEAHRSLFNVYRAIFDYFDSFLIGLTATPSKAVDRSTYEILDLNVNEPTFELKFEEAVNLGYLVSYKAFDKSSELAKKGLKREDVDPGLLDEFDEIAQQGDDPEFIGGEEFRKHLLNNDTIDKMFADLFEFGLRVDNGNKIGKTLIFAPTSKIADAIEDRFKKRYPKLGDDFCQTIYHEIKKNKTRQTNFAKKDSNPQIVISVDMMDTGVDIPEIVNLVFYKKVLSRIKFDQMWGRGTRICKDLRVVSPDKDYFEGRSIDDERKEYNDKQGFFIFDYGGNFKYFDEHPEGNDPSVTINLNQKIYDVYLQMIFELQKIQYQEQVEYKKYYNDLKDQWIQKIQDLDVNRMDVHKNLIYVDKYKNSSNWAPLTESKMFEIRKNLLKLIDPDSTDDVYYRSFELRIATIQLSLLSSSVNSIKQQKQLLEVANKLLTGPQGSIPEVFAKKELLKEICDEHFFDNLEFFKIEQIKKEIGPLVRYLKGESEGVIITNFNDKIETTERDVTFNFDDFRTYKEKIVLYLRKHFGDIKAIEKILNLEELSQADIDEITETLNGLKTEGDEDIYATPEELIVFIRQIIRLDRKVIDEKFAKLLNKYSFTKEQRRIIDLIIDYAIRNGNITNSDLVNTQPFSDINISKEFNNNIDPILLIVQAFNSCLHISA